MASGWEGAVPTLSPVAEKAPTPSWPRRLCAASLFSPIYTCGGLWRRMSRATRRTVLTMSRDGPGTYFEEMSLLLANFFVTVQLAAWRALPLIDRPQVLALNNLMTDSRTCMDPHS